MTKLNLQRGDLISPVGGHFSAGYFRPDPPRPTAVIPEGPQHDAPEGPETVSQRDARLRDQRTKANLAAHHDALKPRRWTPPA